jgi:FixJ family two-component response regulator
LTDVIMPGPTGPELARRLLLERPDTRVLYMSGYPNRPGTQLELLHGDERMLVKPFTAGVLLQKVRDALGASPSPGESVSTSVIEDNAMMASSSA